MKNMKKALVFCLFYFISCNIFQIFIPYYVIIICNK